MDMAKERSIEAENMINEIKEIVEKCVECGMCKGLCPVFRQIREETISPRGKAMILKEGIYDKIVYKCTLCKACEKKCPLNLSLPDAFIKTRAVLVEAGKETKENKEMMEKVRQDGNPFGKEIKKGGKLYCC
jgi:Fe-S oxidoreductase